MVNTYERDYAWTMTRINESVSPESIPCNYWTSIHAAARMVCLTEVRVADDAALHNVALGISAGLTIANSLGPERTGEWAEASFADFLDPRHLEGVPPDLLELTRDFYSTGRIASRACNNMAATLMEYSAGRQDPSVFARTVAENTDAMTAFVVARSALRLKQATDVLDGMIDHVLLALEVTDEEVPTVRDHLIRGFAEYVVGNLMVTSGIVLLVTDDGEEHVLWSRDDDSLGKKE